MNPSDWGSAVLLKLHARVQNMAQKGGLDQQQSAEVFHSYPQFSDQVVMSKQTLDSLARKMSLNDLLMVCPNLHG